MKNTAVETLLEEFFSQYHLHTYKTGHIIQVAHSISPGIYMVKSGLVKQYVLTPDGQEMVVNTYKPYSFFPMIPAVTGLPNNYFFESVGDVTVYLAPQPETVAFIRNHQEVCWDLLKRLYSGVDALLLQMTYNSTGTAEQKVIQALLMLGARFGVKHNGEIALTTVFTHRDISLLTGTSRESVSRVVEQLRAQKAIAIEKRSITKIKPALLRAQLSRR